MFCNDQQQLIVACNQVAKRTSEQEIQQPPRATQLTKLMQTLADSSAAIALNTSTTTRT